MNPQLLIPYTPFLAVLYLAYALIQSLRKKRQGIFAALLALIALVVPIVALFLAQDFPTRTTLVGYLTLNGLIVFVGSLIILMIERGNPSKSAYRSYGILGIEVSALIAVVIFIYPLLATSFGGRTNDVNGAQADNSTLENVSASATTVSPFGELVAAQTGLTADALTTQLQAGSTIADLVTKNKGDLDAVTKAAASALDDLVNKGGVPAQLISRLGTDTTAITTQFEQGKLQGRAQGLLTTVLLTGAMPSFQGRQNAAGANGAGGAAGGNTGAAGGNGGFNGGTGGSGRGNGGFNGGTGGNGTGRRNNGASAESTAESTADPASAGGNNGAAANGTPAPADQNGDQVALQPTAIPATPTEPVIRPTVITFPTFVPTLESILGAPESTADASSAGATAVASDPATCTITPIYNLNLRDKPTTDGTIYLSIPFSTPVTANGRTSDNWYSVTYNGKAGWVSGGYVATDGLCAKLPIVKAS